MASQTAAQEERKHIGWVGMESGVIAVLDKFALPDLSSDLTQVGDLRYAPGHAKQMDLDGRRFNQRNAVTAEVSAGDGFYHVVGTYNRDGDLLELHVDLRHRMSFEDIKEIETRNQQGKDHGAV